MSVSSVQSNCGGGQVLETWNAIEGRSDGRVGNRSVSASTEAATAVLNRMSDYWESEPSEESLEPIASQRGFVELGEKLKSLLEKFSAIFKGSASGIGTIQTDMIKFFDGE